MSENNGVKIIGEWAVIVTYIEILFVLACSDVSMDVKLSRSRVYTDARSWILESRKYTVGTNTEVLVDKMTVRANDIIDEDWLPERRLRCVAFNRFAEYDQGLLRNIKKHVVTSCVSICWDYDCISSSAISSENESLGNYNLSMRCTKNDYDAGVECYNDSGFKIVSRSRDGDISEDSYKINEEDSELGINTDSDDIVLGVVDDIFDREQLGNQMKYVGSEDGMCIYSNLCDERMYGIGDKGGIGCAVFIMVTKETITIWANRGKTNLKSLISSYRILNLFKRSYIDRFTLCDDMKTMIYEESRLVLYVMRNKCRQVELGYVSENVPDCVRRSLEDRGPFNITCKCGERNIMYSYEAKYKNNKRSMVYMRGIGNIGDYDNGVVINVQSQVRYNKTKILIKNSTCMNEINKTAVQVMRRYKEIFGVSEVAAKIDDQIFQSAVSLMNTLLGLSSVWQNDLPKWINFSCGFALLITSAATITRQDAAQILERVEGSIIGRIIIAVYNTPFIVFPFIVSLAALVQVYTNNSGEMSLGMAVVDVTVSECDLLNVIEGYTSNKFRIITKSDVLIYTNERELYTMVAVSSAIVVAIIIYKTTKSRRLTNVSGEDLDENGGG